MTARFDDGEGRACAQCGRHGWHYRAWAPCWPFGGWYCTVCGECTLDAWGTVWAYVFFLDAWWNGTIRVRR